MLSGAPAYYQIDNAIQQSFSLSIGGMVIS